MYEKIFILKCEVFVPIIIFTNLPVKMFEVAVRPNKLKHQIHLCQIDTAWYLVQNYA